MAGRAGPHENDGADICGIRTTDFKLGPVTDLDRDGGNNRSRRWNHSAVSVRGEEIGWGIDLHVLFISPAVRVTSCDPHGRIGHEQSDGVIQTWINSNPGRHPSLQRWIKQVRRQAGSV